VRGPRDLAAVPFVSRPTAKCPDLTSTTIRLTTKTPSHKGFVDFLVPSCLGGEKSPPVGWDKSDEVGRGPTGLLRQKQKRCACGRDGLVTPYEFRKCPDLSPVPTTGSLGHRVNSLVKLSDPVPVIRFCTARVPSHLTLS
jgi:hypothetical protein